MFYNVPYPLEMEFRADSAPLQGIFAIDHPTSTPLVGALRAPYGYRELVPIRIVTVDSIGVTGTHLQDKMYAELKYINETYHAGSERKLDRRASHDRPLGSTMLYDAEFIMDYERDTTT